MVYHKKGLKKWHYKSTSSSSVYIKKLKKGARYVIKVRAYRLVNGKRVYGKWSRLRTSGKVL